MTVALHATGEVWLHTRYIDICNTVQWVHRKTGADHQEMQEREQRHSHLGPNRHHQQRC